MSSLVYIQPALAALTLVKPNIHSLFLCILLPGYNRLTLQDASASFAGKRSECNGEIFKLWIC